MSEQLPGEAALTPREIVAYLDRFIVGQKDAKKAVAIALRNRWRRKMVPEDLQEEILPKNIIMIGPTGVGKTEIARRLARLASLPFLKIEASKFTEVGYVGRDVDSIVRDLMETAVGMVRKEEEERVASRARDGAANKVLDLLMRRPTFEEADPVETDGTSRRRQKLRQQLEAGLLDGQEVTVSVQDRSFHPMIEIFGSQGMEQMGVNLREMMGNMFPAKRKERRLPVGEALRLLEQEEAAGMVDSDKVTEEARRRVEQSGIVFLDEIDKIAGRESTHGPDVSREGVQRDLLPIIEGTTVSTKYGPVRTDHILFIASGAFHVSKPSDLIPELQGRFPIRVELQALSREDFRRILVEPENSLIRQYTALLRTEQVQIEFTDDGIAAIAELAVQANEQLENIGARRLYTILEKLLEDLSFEAPDIAGGRMVFTRDEVMRRLGSLVQDQDMSKYVL
ncbi:MAG: ATP-dependent protease ATPase subunit HslU [Deltaproteobacteria bacterium]|nr:ATP-dependent protease ATPase subunit HslU [Deltaproteobacteria bacterium]